MTEMTGATPARLAPLLAQGDVSWELLRDRLGGLTDDEYVREPAPGAATVARDPQGRWRPSPTPDEEGVRSIAWLCGHLGEAGIERQDYLLPLLDIVWRMNRELIHHGAEIACLRDLYASNVAGRRTIS
jgi:hypothetical protein